MSDKVEAFRKQVANLSVDGFDRDEWSRLKPQYAQLKSDPAAIREIAVWRDDFKTLFDSLDGQKPNYDDAYTAILPVKYNRSQRPQLSPLAQGLLDKLDRLGVPLTLDPNKDTPAEEIRRAFAVFTPEERVWFAEQIIFHDGPPEFGLRNATLLEIGHLLAEGGIAKSDIDKCAQYLVDDGWRGPEFAASFAQQARPGTRREISHVLSNPPEKTGNPAALVNPGETTLKNYSFLLSRDQKTIAVVNATSTGDSITLQDGRAFHSGRWLRARLKDLVADPQQPALRSFDIEKWRDVLVVHPQSPSNPAQPDPNSALLIVFSNSTDHPGFAIISGPNQVINYDFKKPVKIPRVAAGTPLIL